MAKVSRCREDILQVLCNTDKGNIGPVVDAVLDEYGLTHTVICPALPVNGVKLENSHMKNHSLTSMRDSYVPRLMVRQARCRAFTVSADEMRRIADGELMLPTHEGHHCFVPNLYEDSHAELIAEGFGDLPFLIGGSGLAGELGRGKTLLSSPEAARKLRFNKLQRAEIRRINPSSARKDSQRRAIPRKNLGHDS